MPILDDIMDHDLLGPAIRRSREEGIEEGRAQGKQQEALAVIRRLLAARFGLLSPELDDRLRALSLTELEALAVRSIQVGRIEDLF